MTASLHRGRCPRCQCRLRIPAAWVGRMVRCTQCGTVVQANARIAALTSTPAPEIVAAATPRADAPTPPPAPALSDLTEDFLSPIPPLPSPIPAFDLGGPAFPSPGVQIRRPLPKRMATGTKVGLGVAATCALIGAVVVGFMFGDRFAGLFTSPESAKGPAVASSGTTPKSASKRTALPGSSGPFPRRLLAISVNQYLYANPTQSGSEQRGVGAWATKLGDKLKIPKEQIAVVSDSGKQPHPPLKATIEQSVEKYLATCRPQDRAILLFVGHAVEIDGEGYLVPLEGEMTVKETLIPLKWLYEKLAACPARQKLFIADVCRYDPTIGLERPGSGPMADKLAEQLKNPPAGVQVWSACSAKEYSYEFVYEGFETGIVEGGLFLNQFFSAFQQGAGIPKPDDPLPIAMLNERVAAQTSKNVGRLKVTQTPFLAGSEKDGGTPYSAAEPPPPKIELPAMALADAKVARGILEEITLPPIKQLRGEENSLSKRLDLVFPFAADAMAAYLPDYQTMDEMKQKASTSPLRAATLQCVETLRRNGEGKVKLGNTVKSVGTLREDFPAGKNSEKDKKDVAKDQKEGPALILAELDEAMGAMEKAGKERDKEPSKRWQVHYDYVYAQLKARYAYVNEYNLMLAKIRKDEMPALDEKVHKGWRLSSQEKLTSGKDIKDYANDSKKAFERIAKENPGTPWAILAKQARFTALGLKWEPASFGESKQ